MFRKPRMVWLSVVCLSLTATVPGVVKLPSWLSPVHGPHGRLAVVEGWMDSLQLQIAARHLEARSYDQIVVVGGPTPNRPFSLYLSGEITFLPNPETPPKQISSISFVTHSSVCKGQTAHFQLWHGPTLHIDAYCPEGEKRWEFSFEAIPTAAGLIKIAFLNDCLDGKDDLNLVLDEMMINGAPWQTQFERVRYQYGYDGKLHEEFRFASYAHRGAGYLAFLGLPPEKLTVCPTNYHPKGGNTLGEAMGFARWYRLCEGREKAATLVSGKHHGRRSLGVFRRQAPEISWRAWTAWDEPPQARDWLNKPERCQMLRQALKLAASWIMFRPDTLPGGEGNMPICNPNTSVSGVDITGLTGFP